MNVPLNESLHKAEIVVDVDVQFLALTGVLPSGSMSRRRLYKDSFLGLALQQLFNFPLVVLAFSLFSFSAAFVLCIFAPGDNISSCMPIAPAAGCEPTNHVALDSLHGLVHGSFCSCWPVR